MKARQQNNANYPIVFLMVDAADHITGMTGLTPAVTISKAGSAFTLPYGSVTELGNGWYSLTGHINDRSLLGNLVIHAEATGADPFDDCYSIVAYDPFNQVCADVRQWNGGSLPAISSLTEAGVRSALGLASANLDTQLGNIPTVAEFNARSLPSADYFVVGDYTAPPSEATIATQVASTLATAHGSGSWATATGFSTLTAAQVWQYATRTLSAFSFSVTVGANNDKTGYSLSSAYDPAKTAAQAGNQMALTSAALSSVRSGLATSAELAALETHGDENWATATGFSVLTTADIDARLAAWGKTGFALAPSTGWGGSALPTAFAASNLPTKYPASLAAADVTGDLPARVNGYASGQAPYQGTPPSALAIRQEIDASSEKLVAILMDTDEIQGKLPAGVMASSDEVVAIQNNTTVVRVVPSMIERPDAGAVVYRVEILLYDSNGNMDVPDETPTIELVNNLGDDRTSRLDSATMTLVSTGRYRAVYTASASDALEQLIWTFTVTKGTLTRLYGNTSWVADTTAVDYTAADRARDEAVAAKVDVSLSSRAPADTALTTTVWTAARAGHLDKLDVPGTLAHTDNATLFKATGFVTPAEVQALQAHGDTAWATADTSGLATAAVLAAMDTKVDAILDDTGTSGVVMAGYVAPDNAGIAAIKAQTDKLVFAGSDVMATLDGEKVAATLAVGDVTGNLPATVNGYAPGLEPVAIDNAAIAEAVDQQLTTSHGAASWVASEVDLSGVATSAELAVIQAHGDAAWTTATGFATPADLQALQTHGDDTWATVETSGLATSAGLGEVAASLQDMQEAFASGVPVAGESVLAIRNGLSTFNANEEGVLLAANQPAYAPAKPGDAMTLTSEERTAVASALLQLANGIETGFSLQDALRFVAAAVAGLVSGAGSGVERFKGLDQLTDRLTVLVDEQGNRTGITYHR